VLVALGVLAGAFVAVRSPRNRAPQFAVVLAKMKELTEQMFQCRERDCGQKVSEQMMKWLSETQKPHDSSVTLDEQQRQQADEVSRKLGECMQRAMGVSPGPQLEEVRSQEPPARDSLVK
jgi:hypothetical protein